MKTGKSSPHIAESEWEVMKVLWKKSPMAAREIIDALASVKDWKPKTVKTLLNRLVNKGAVSFKQEGKNYIYTHAVSQKECARSEAKSFLRRVYDGSPRPMIAAFIEEEKLTPEDIRELKRILDKKGG
jgi:BlaI family penicillinase repressor